MKRRSILFFLACFMFVFASCGGGGEAPASKLQKATSGDAYYGNIFRYNEESEWRDLFPLNITEVVAHRMSLNIYEGLVTLSQDKLKVEPLLAESFDMSEDGLTYTFKLRQGVMFHDDECFEGGKGRELKAQDVKFCFDLLCSQVDGNQGFWVFQDKVKGANAHYAATQKGEKPAGGVEGVQVIDDYTIQITLEQSFPDFIRLLVTPFTYVFPKEAYEQYGSQGMRTRPVGSGPFYVKRLQEGQFVSMLKNENYWGKDAQGNQLPYLDGIRVGFIKEQKSALLEFEKGNLDMLYRLPLEMVENIMTNERQLKPKYEQYQLQISPTMSFQYYGFQHKIPPFDDVNLRKAFNYAVDRKKVIDFVLKGLGQQAFGGAVPPIFKEYTGYDASKVKGYEYSPEKALEYLEKAGYPQGKGLESVTLQINSGGGRNELIAEAIAKQLEQTLGIEIKLTQLPFPEHLDACETGKAVFWRAGWVADYTSPENFLRLYYGKSVPKDMETNSYLNTVRYTNAAYDKKFDQAMATVNTEARQAIYTDLEQMIVDDAVVMPLYFNEEVRLLQGNVRNLPQNAMEYRYFRDTYFVPEAQ